MAEPMVAAAREGSHTSSYRAWAEAFSIYRAPFIVALLATLVLSSADQIIDLYRLHLEKPDLIDARAAWALASLLALSFSLIVICDVGRGTPLTSRQVSVQDAGTAARYLPALIGALPFLGVAYGLYQVANPDWLQDFGLDTYRGPDRLRVHILCVAALVTAVALFVLPGRATAFRDQLSSALWAVTGRTWGRWIWGTIAVLAWFIPAAAFVNSPVHLPQRLGTLPILALFFVVLAVTTTMMTRLRDATQVPVFGIVVALALLWGLTSVNDNHRVRTIANDPERGVGRSQDLTTVFYDWQLKRKDAIDAFVAKGRRYPVYFVAAEGGGMYAALHTASFLARLQDACPSFARHVFLISGVSGGSVGASVFSGLQKTLAASDVREACGPGDGTPGQIEQRVQAVFANDLLSPLAAAALFPDFLQRFIPYPVERFDRARALEFALEAAWSGSVKENPDWIAKSYFGTWTADGATPALVLNTTQVETGQRIVIAPFNTGGLSGKQGNIRDIRLSLEKGEGLATSTAAILSARFSWITPAGWLPSVSKSHFTARGAMTGIPSPPAANALSSRTLRMVDGGYFENSGVETAEDMRLVLKERYPDLPLDLQLIIIAGQPAVNPAGQSLGELLSPIRGLNAARMQRGALAQIRATGGECSAHHTLNGVPQSLQNCLELGGSSLPLSWVLSPFARARVSEQTASGEMCEAIEEKMKSDGPEIFLSMAQFNQQVNCEIVRQMILK